MKVGMSGALMSSNYRKGDISKEAAIALNGDDKSYFHTKCAQDEWWSAQFKHKTLVTEVRIFNRNDGHGHTMNRLAKSLVLVEGKECGSLPDKTPGAEWYTVKCDVPVAGKNIMVKNT